MITHSRNSKNTALMKDANKGEILSLISAHHSFHKETHLQNLLPWAAQSP